MAAPWERFSVRAVDDRCFNCTAVSSSRPCRVPSTWNSECPSPCMLPPSMCSLLLEPSRNGLWRSTLRRPRCSVRPVEMAAAARRPKLRSEMTYDSVGKAVLPAATRQAGMHICAVSQ
eukprot:scaffold16878_cov134-Isochrysis_galbana.AAC.4